MSKRFQYKLQEIPENDIEHVQLIRKGKFDHAWFGKFDITEEVLREFKLNFDRRARRVDIAIDYFHESGAEAAGWVKSIELKENDTELWVTVDWTAKAKEKILGKEIKYISAEFDLDYIDSETGKEYGATLYGAGITNRPHVKDMKPIFSELITNKSINKKNKGKDMTIDFNEMLESVGELSEDEKLQLGEKLGFTTKTSDADADAKKLSDAEDAKKLAETSLKSKDASIKKLSDRVDALVVDNAKKDKTAIFDTMFTNGSVVEAQRTAFMDDDMAEFARNAVSGINLSGAGSGASSEDDIANVASTKFNEVCKALVEDEGLTFSEAAKRATSENPALLNK